MKATELRIGNLTEQGEAKSFHEHGIHVGSGKCYVFSELKPIPLTEEWLLKFGFTKLGNSCSCFITDSLYISLCNNVFYMVTSEYEEDDDRIYHPEVAHELQIKYVHQLQNLYFALTGEELNDHS